MTGCKLLRRDMLPQPVDVQIGGGVLDLDQATKIAIARARKLHPEVMLMAWFDRKAGEYSPKIEC
jgi:hypothetical protein